MKAKGRHPSNKLTPLKVKRETTAGIYADGNGLYLKVDKSGAKRWIQRILINGKRTDMGLGGVSIVSLAEAREVARNNRALARKGGDPLAEKRMRMEIPTFESATYSVYELNKPTWKNEKHAQQWISTMEDYVFPFFGSKKIDKINSSDVLNALTPIWTKKPTTARRTKQRIGAVLKWSIGKGWRTDNPSSEIQQSLPKHQKSENHHKSLPYDEVAHAIEKTKASNALAITKLAFEFLVLTATRSGDVRGAQWAEINGSKWVIPKERMKANKEHRIPLSPRCMEIIATLETLKKDSNLLFNNNGKILPDAAFSKLMKDLEINAVPHGFRTSFRMWASEKSNYPWQVCEFALAHVVGDEAERAYQRSDLFDKRRNLMESWAQYVGNESANVIPMISSAKG